MNLSNNSNDMKTIVETFVIEETAELIYDGEKLEQWNKRVAELGLIGQSTIVKKDKSPVPFMYMNQNIRNVFECLCPRKVPIEQYNVTPIPVEILDLIALSKNEQYFDKIEIWYDDKDKDPACIGLRWANEDERKKGYSWNMEHYLLGKWADVKHSFDELKVMATKRFKAFKTNELTQMIKDAQRELEDLDNKSFNDFGNMNTSDLPF